MRVGESSIRRHKAGVSCSDHKVLVAKTFFLFLPTSLCQHQTGTAWGREGCFCLESTQPSISSAEGVIVVKKKKKKNKCLQNCLGIYWISQDRQSKGPKPFSRLQASRQQWSHAAACASQPADKFHQKAAFVLRWVHSDDAVKARGWRDASHWHYREQSRSLWRMRSYNTKGQKNSCGSKKWWVEKPASNRKSYQIK